WTGVPHRPTTKNNTPVKRGRKLIAVVVPSEQVCSTKKKRVDLGEANATLDRDELDADAEGEEEVVEEEKGGGWRRRGEVSRTRRENPYHDLVAEVSSSDEE
ncbi:hypothetical protein PTTG_11424, partial [Puccinia triticina 1-1 BBBD Race 1]